MKIRALKNTGSRSEGDEFDTTSKVGDFLVAHGVATIIEADHSASREETKPTKRNRRSTKGGGTPVPSEPPTAG